MECGKTNFTYKCFYNDDLNEVYVFYRQGHQFRVNGSNTSDFFYQRVTELDLGQMFLIYNKILVSRSSKSVYWFKMEVDDDTGERLWKLYHEIEAPAFISYTKGNVRLQLI